MRQPAVSVVKMELLKKTRNEVEDLYYRGNPIVSPDERLDLVQSLVLGIRALVASLSSGVVAEATVRKLCAGVKHFSLLQDNSEPYFAAELCVIETLFELLFDPREMSFQKRMELLGGLREMISHQRRQVSHVSIPCLDWSTVMNSIVSAYAETSQQHSLTALSAMDRAELIAELSRLMKEIVHFNKPLALIDFALAMLRDADLLVQSAVDSVDIAFTMLGFFGGDDLVPILADANSALWLFYNRVTQQSPTWVHPRLELQLLTVLGKLDPRHLVAVKSIVVDSGMLRDLLALGIGFIGIPSSAVDANKATTPAIETAGLHKQTGSLVGGDKRRVVGKLARIAVALIWTNDESVASTGWRFIELISVRTETLLLASTTMNGKSSDESGRWPFRLCDLYTSIVHHWLRRKTKAAFLHTALQPDHARIVNLIMPGVVNVVKNTFSGGVGPAVATRYVSVFTNLMRIAGTAASQASADQPLSLLTETLSDVHKAMVHGILVLSGVLPACGLVSSFSSAASADALSFLLDFCVESLDTTNLMKTVSVLGLLDVLLIQVPHGWTLRDLAAATASNDQESRLLMTSTTFGDWSCRLFERLLALDLPKPGGASIVAVSAVSSEGMEMIGRSIAKRVFSWIVANVDPPTLVRLENVAIEYFASDWSTLTTQPHRQSLVGGFISSLLKHRFSSSIPDYLLKRVNATDMTARQNKTAITLLSHALRYSQDQALHYYAKLEPFVVAVLTSATTPTDLKKVVVKFVQRIAESVALLYVVNASSYSESRNRDSQFLISKISKSPTDVQSAWWSASDADIKWHVPAAASVDRLVTRLRALLDATAADDQTWLRVVIAIGKSIMQRVTLVSDSGISQLRNELLEKLHTKRPDETRVKQTTLWLKAARFLLTASLGDSGETELALILRELSGFKIENLVEFGFIGKEFEILDETRFEYIGSKCDALLHGVIALRSGMRALSVTETALFRAAVVTALRSQFDKVKVRSLLLVKEWLEVHRSGADCATYEDLVRVVVRETMAVLTQPVLQKHEATGVGLVINFNRELALFCSQNSATTMTLFEALLQHLVKPAIDPEVMEPLVGIIRDLWNDRPRVSRTRPAAGEAVSQGLTMVESIFSAIHNNPGMYWKSQVSLLVMGYIVWRFFPAQAPASAVLVHNLSLILSHGDVTPLPASVRDFVVFWLHALLVFDTETVRECVDLATVRRVLKVFAIGKRFEATSSRRDTVDVIAAQVMQDEVHTNLFSSGHIPRLSNKGVLERNVVFWSLLVDGSVSVSEVVDATLSLVTTESSVNDDDVHCTSLEVFAALLSKLRSNDWIKFVEFLRSEIARGDGALVPTIATAVRIGVEGLGVRSLIPLTAPTNEELVLQTFTALRSEVARSEESSLMRSRLLLLMNNAVLIDLNMLRLLDLSEFTAYLIEHLLNESNPEEVREIAGGVLSRILLVEGLDSATEHMVVARMREFLSGEQGVEENQAKIAIVQLASRVMKARRSPPTWYREMVPVALSCVGSPKEETKQAGIKFFNLLARFVNLETALGVATSPGIESVGPKQHETLIDLVVNAAMNSVTKSESLLWKCDSNEIGRCLHSQFVQPVHDALFSRSAASVVSVNEGSSPEAVSAAKDALTDLYVLDSSDLVRRATGPSVADATSLPVILELAARVSVASLAYDVPEWGLSTISKLAHLIPRDLPVNAKRVAQTALTEFLKAQTNRGTREKTERMFDSDVLSLVRSTKTKHSYIS